MKSFTFNGQSSLDVLDDELFLCEFETSGTLPSYSREIIKGEVNRYRGVANYFGVKESESIVLPIGFVKKSGKPFTVSDRDAIEYWLTMNEIPKPFTVFGAKDKKSIFNGIITSYEWRVVGKFVIGLVAYLECDSRYWYDLISEKLQVDFCGGVVLRNDSMDKEVYPVISITNKENADSTFEMINNRDNNYFRVNIKALDTVTINSELCIIQTGQSYEDLGLSDCEYIKWPKIYKGENIIQCNGGKFEVSINYKRKHLGLGNYFSDEFDEPVNKSQYARISGTDLIIIGESILNNKKEVVITGTVSEGIISL